MKENDGDFKKVLRKIMQKHYEYYIKKFKEGKVPSDDPQYRLAIEREKQGIVQPMKTNLI